MSVKRPSGRPQNKKLLGVDYIYARVRQIKESLFIEGSSKSSLTTSIIIHSRSHVPLVAEAFEWNYIPIQSAKETHVLTPSPLNQFNQVISRSVQRLNRKQYHQERVYFNHCITQYTCDE